MLDTERPTLGISLGGGWPLGMPEPRQIMQFARLIEELGFAALWTGDHVLMYSPMVHALVTLSAAAAVTERVAIGTGVYLLGLRHPVEAGKAIASLDWLANGRFIFGVGVGGEIAAEWAACGVPRTQRGARVDEGLQALKALWAGPHASHAGRFWQFEDISIQPLPIQPGGPPVVVGGRSEAAWRRAARHDGWMGYLLTPERLAQGFAAIDAQRQAEGRDGAFLRSHLLFSYIGPEAEARAMARRALEGRYNQSFETLVDKYCLIGPPETARRRLAEFYAAGVRHITLSACADIAGYERQLRLAAEELLPALPQRAKA